MSSQLFSLFFPSSTTLTFNAFFGFLFLVAIFGYWLVPGGLAWALSKNRTSIPGPSGLPVLGLVLPFTGTLTHRVLAKLAHTFKAKPLMAFSVGFTRFIISTNPDTAKEILNSSAFADRPVKESAYELLFHRAMGFAPFGEYWRNLRRISATHMFSPRRIASSGEFRAAVGARMVRDITGMMMERNGEVVVRKVLHFGSLNNVMMSVFGRSYEFGEGGDGCEVEELVREGYDLLGVFNWSDHFPLLGWFDFQGVRKRCRNLVARVNLFVGKIILEHRMNKRVVQGDEEEEKNADESYGDFVDVLLHLEKENRLQHSDMVAVLWEMIFRGTDTVAILLEWILARMTLHPEIQAKAQTEIDSVVGYGRMVTDLDLPKLHYLRAIVKETLRMHPPGPLLSWARLAIEDTHIGQHFIPAGTTAMVNMWGITHDRDVWSDPEKFKPERFLEGEDVPILGSDLRLAPFGAGRRVCPGKAMGLATVELWLAILLQSFKWMPGDSVVDLSECLKLSLEMKSSLVSNVVARPGLSPVLASAMNK